MFPTPLVVLLRPLTMALVLSAVPAQTPDPVPEGETHRVAVADIASRSKPISAMVPMAGILTPREVRDLVEFLSSLKR